MFSVGDSWINLTHLFKIWGKRGAVEQSGILLKMKLVLCSVGQKHAKASPTPLCFCRHSGIWWGKSNFCSLKRRDKMQQNTLESPRWEMLHDSGMYHDNFGIFFFFFFFYNISCSADIPLESLKENKILLKICSHSYWVATVNSNNLFYVGSFTALLMSVCYFHMTNQEASSILKLWLLG